MSEATDPLALGVDLNDVDTGRPVLPKAQYVMKVDNVEVVENKVGTGRNLILDFATTQPTESIKGAQVNVGFRIRNYYPLQPSENNPDSDLWKQRLARLQDTLLATKQGERGEFNPYDFKERQVIADIDIETSEEYGDQNRVKKIASFDED